MALRRDPAHLQPTAYDSRLTTHDSLLTASILTTDYPPLQVIMNLFGIPLNLLVISVFLSIKRLGVSGALRVATGSLGLATACAAGLVVLTRKPADSAAAK